MSVQKAVEYMNKILDTLDEYAIDDSIIRKYTLKALEELKSNKEMEWGNVQKCVCGKNSECHINKKDGSIIYLCLVCFFKYEGK